MLVKGTYKNKLLSLAAFMLLCSAVSFAQYNGQADFDKAVTFWNEFGKNKTDISKIDSAKKYIEKAFADENIRKIGSANNIRGAVYKENYKAREAQDYKSLSREVAATCFLESLKADTTARNRDIVKPQLKWIAVQYYNDSKRAMEKHSDFEASQENFNQFKKLIVISDPNFNLKQKEVEFELATGTAYQDKGMQTGKKEFFDLAKVTYLKILDKDSLNGDANFNIATMYYNQGANIILKTMNFDTPIDSISIYEDMANKLFRQAEPFMNRAHKIRPNCLKIMEGLKGIYYSLNEEEKFKHFKALYDKLKADIESGAKKEEC